MNTLPVALQLYTVRDELEKNLEAALKAVKDAGYDYVETAGLFGLTGAEFKKALEAAGLTAISAHVPLVELAADPEAAVANYNDLGVDYIAVPYLPEDQRPGTPAYAEVIANIKKVADACEKMGKTLVYHNHDFEFVKIGDKYALDLMYENIPALQTELDTCWVSVGGECPVAYIKKYAGRCPVVHLKDYVGSKSENMYELIGIESDGKKADASAFAFRPVGQGKQDFKAILAASVESGAKYVVVEQDNTYETPSLVAAKQSRDYLKTLGW
ncbi:MAG: sugar phosphate isomerase/epimerase [Ruminococcaceae bacterium]|nr:sugar phosphate isomerase/epimerase [Oscillospiraceae bacterium]